MKGLAVIARQQLHHIECSRSSGDVLSYDLISAYPAGQIKLRFDVCWLARIEPELFLTNFSGRGGLLDRNLTGTAVPQAIPPRAIRYRS